VTEHAAADVAALPAVQYLTFRLGAAEYAIEILKVQEIKAVSTITPMPHMPPSVKGVMNLRGAIIPIVDLRTRLGMTDATYGRFTVIVVVTLGPKVIGLVVDGVSDVIANPAADVEPPPSLTGGRDSSVVHGLAHVGDRLVMLLDLDATLRHDESITTTDA
jgi:purine-binding chemotaxis protein CheW